MARNEFSPMLSATLTEDTFHKIRYPIWCSPKLDGIRVLTREDGAKTRSNKFLPNAHAQKLLSHPLLVGLDGEAIVGDWRGLGVMQRCTSGLMSHGGEPDLTYHVFGSHQSLGNSWIERYGAADAIIERYYGHYADGNVISKTNRSNFKVVIVEQRLCDNLEEVLAFEKYCLEELHVEGIMLHRGDGHYKNGRSTINEFLSAKLKRFVDIDIQIIGWDYLYRNDNEQFKDDLGYAKRSSHQENMTKLDMVGRLNYRVLNTQGNQAALIAAGYQHLIGTEGWVGSGFDQATRKQLFERANNDDESSRFIGEYAVIKFQLYGSKDAPRIPIWKGFRHKDDM